MEKKCIGMDQDCLAIFNIHHINLFLIDSYTCITDILQQHY